MPERTRIQLDPDLWIEIGELDDEGLVAAHLFDGLWALRPPLKRQVPFLGKPVTLPRREQAYERSYRFSRATATAVAAPPLLRPYLDWAKSFVDARLIGILVNWYDGEDHDYIGPHRDNTRQLVPGCPIVTVSLGEERVFRLTRAAKGDKCVRDVIVRNGSVVVLPWDTNRHWKHGVPSFARYRGRRISVTLRAFKDE